MATTDIGGSWRCQVARIIGKADRQGNREPQADISHRASGPDPAHAAAETAAEVIYQAKELHVLDFRLWNLLIDHYVNYRKSFAPREPVTAFGLYAVATRHPSALLREVESQRVKAGVYIVRALRQSITVIVLMIFKNLIRYC